MPVVDGEFIPRSPLTPAEEHVDWAATNQHVVSQREQVEKKALPATRRLAVLAVQQHGFASPRLIDDLARVLATELERTARFGAASALAELDRLRAANTASAALVVPDAGRYARIAARGLLEVLGLMRHRATEASYAVSQSVHTAIAAQSLGAGNPLDAALVAAKRALHNQVLELVGESLNLGRAAGALSSPSVPEFALRSEQLDRNTCEPCDELHGTITVVGSPEFYAITPPIGCLGGGRCRGIWVFGDGPSDVRAPELLAA